MADVISLVLTCLGGLAWVICLGGVAAVTSVNGVSQSTTALAWLAVWFTFFLYAFSLLVSVGSFKCARLRTDLFLIVTTVWIIVAWNCNIALDGVVAGKLESSYGALMAGAVLVLMLHFLLIIYWGMTENGTQPLQLGRKTEAEGAAPPTAPDAKDQPAEAMAAV